MNKILRVLVVAAVLAVGFAPQVSAEKIKIPAAVYNNLKYVAQFLGGMGAAGLVTGFNFSRAISQIDEKIAAFNEELDGLDDDPENDAAADELESKITELNTQKKALQLRRRVSLGLGVPSSLAVLALVVLSQKPGFTIG